MLDGLEVADPALRGQVVAWVERQANACCNNRFMVSSRPHGYQSNPLSSATVLEAAPFSWKQVQRFVHNWYLATEVMRTQRQDTGVEQQAREGAEELLGRLRRTQVLSELAINPLLLTMIANVHYHSNKLPERRVELYAEICEVFLGKRQAARGIESDSDLTPMQKQRVLQVLAHEMMSRKTRTLPLDDVAGVISEPLSRVSPGMAGSAFVKVIEEGSGLLVEHEHGIYAFSHLTFQEYLASEHVRDLRLDGALVERVEDTWWHETIRLYCARADATPVIRACLRPARPSLAVLSLAVQCLDEARDVQPEVRARLVELLKTGVEDADPERSRVAREALLAWRLYAMVQIDVGYRDA